MLALGIQPAMAGRDRTAEIDRESRSIAQADDEDFVEEEFDEDFEDEEFDEDFVEEEFDEDFEDEEFD
ncbi:hypothetical protein, partial [Baaleninema sp.]|uniref:hypothetical protein n=1 Tax=Baaleninema sp. TaxID=3101197 RepID=UPI003D03B0EC